MNKEEIYAALQPTWWIKSTPNNWQTTFLSTVILFDTKALKDCTYISSAPIQTNGLSSGTSRVNDINVYTNDLRRETAQRLYDMHCVAVTGSLRLTRVFNATG